MGSYIINFTVYTMAMLGLIFFAIFVYKKFMNGGIGGNSSKFLEIEETMNINPRKSLLVVRAGNEKFLIASDIDRTTMLSKLNSRIPEQNFQSMVEELAPQQIKKEISQNRIVDLNIVYPEKEPVKLDLIRDKNPQGRTLMDRREPFKSKEQLSNKSVTLDFEKPANHGFAAMKEMAKKINEL